MSRLTVAGGLVLLVSMSLVGPPDALARHGLTLRVSQEGRAVVVRAGYDGGGPARGASVEVFAPGAPAATVAGTTDQEGRFRFVPAEPGDWRIVVNDGMGHRRVARYTLDEALAGAAVALEEQEAHAHDGSEAGMPAMLDPPRTRRGWRVATGIGVIFGLTGLAYRLAARRTPPLAG